VNSPERLAVRGDLVHEAINDRHVRERSHAERDPAGRDHTVNHDRMTLRDVSLEGAISARRGVACDGNLVFHREGQPCGRPEPVPARTRPIDRASGFQHACAVDRIGYVEILVRVVLLQQLRDVCLGRDVAASDARDGFARPHGEGVIAQMLCRACHSKMRKRGRHVVPEM
jgi:hypothetical protein